MTCGLEVNICYIFDGRILRGLGDYGSGKKRTASKQKAYDMPYVGRLKAM